MKWKLPFFSVFILLNLLYATTFHTIPLNGTNDFAADEDFPTSTSGYLGYITWDADNLYLGYTGPIFGEPNDTTRGSTRIFWYVDTDPQPDLKSGYGTDRAATVWTQIMEHQPWWFDEQSWQLPFNADYYIKSSYTKKDSIYAVYGAWSNQDSVWGRTGLDTTFANLNLDQNYYEVKLPWDSLGNPTEINILAYMVSTEWESDLYYSDTGEPMRDVGGTFASWPWSSIRGGDGDKNADGHLDHWFHFHIQDGISPDQENDPPVITGIPDQIIKPGDSFPVVDLNSYVFDDVTPDTLLSWTFSGNIELQLAIDDSNQLTVTMPDTDWIGMETVTFFVQDEGGKSDTDTVIFKVNRAPIALADTAQTYEDTAISLNLLLNDSDPDTMDALSIESILLLTNGSVTIDNDSMVTYTPNADYFGADSFQYVLNDGFGGRDTAMVSLTVFSVNDPPEIVDLPDVVNLDINDSTRLYMADYAYDVDTPDSLLTWSFEVNDPAIGYNYDEQSDSLTIISNGIEGEFYLFTTLTDDSGASDRDTITVRVSNASAISELRAGVPKQFTVLQNYPNPFGKGGHNPSTTQIIYGLSKTGSVRITVYNLLGQRVHSEVFNQQSAGFHKLNFDGNRYPAGIYFYRISAQGRSVVKKMILLK